MKLHLSPPLTKKLDRSVAITGSKSETNRLLLLQALFSDISIENVSNSDDAQVMKNGLAISKGEVDIHHAGTAMRFLTAYFATQEGKEVVLTGSERMKERPIRVLVDALHALGAEIEYVGEDGYPPLRIKGKKLTKNGVSLSANISSQYISALLLVAPSLANGLDIGLIGKITSVPYIKMTLALLDEIGVATRFIDNTIRVFPKNEIAPKRLLVESDWSAASYFYSVVALSAIGSELRLSSYKQGSLQGDSVLAQIYVHFGVDTTFSDATIILTKARFHQDAVFDYDLSNAPDIAQTIAVTCFGLGLGCHLTGLHTLPIKETDRLAAMKTELEKFGGKVSITEASLTLRPATIEREEVSVDTYNDHRMAMAFAPLAMRVSFSVNDAGVVSKSYPDFWKDMKKIGLGVRDE